MASLVLIGTTTASARRNSATMMPKRSPLKKRSLSPSGARRSGRSLSPSVETIALNVRPVSLHKFWMLGLVDGFGIDRHESFAAAGRGHLIAKLLEDFDQEITADGGVLVGEELHALERFALEEIKVALDVGGFAIGCSGQEAGLRVAKDALVIEEGFGVELREEHFTREFDSVVKGLFVLL